MSENTENAVAKDDAESVVGDEKGIMLLLNKGTASYNRLPMLDVICDKFVRLASNSLRNYLADMVDVKIAGIRNLRFGDYIGEATDRTICIFKSEELANIGLLSIESKLVYSMVDILFGGRKVPPVLQVEERPFTSIEIGIVRSISELLLTELGQSFEQVMPISFDLDRVETNPKFAMVLRPEDVVIIVDLEVALDQRSGGLSILLPYITLDPIKKLLAKSYVGNPGQKDPMWTRHIEWEISQSKVELQVVLNGHGIMFAEAAELAVGKTILLDKCGDSPWTITINKTNVGKAELGRVDDNIAVTLLSDGIKVISDLEK